MREARTRTERKRTSKDVRRIGFFNSKEGPTNLPHPATNCHLLPYISTALITELSKDGLVWFYGISTIIGYLMSNLVYSYILNIYYLVGLGFMEYQPLLVIIQC